MKFYRTKIDSTRVFLEELGARNYKHIKHGTLYDHFIRVQEILAHWGCSVDVQLAGLCHSLYSTQYFIHNILNLDNRQILKDKIGEVSENMVYLFSQIDRSRGLDFNRKEDAFILRNYVSKQELTCNTSIGIGLLHVLLANDLDHIGMVGIGSQIDGYKKYKPLSTYLIGPAKEELRKIIDLDTDTKKPTGTYIRFIAHSGVQIVNTNVSVLIDPWLHDSKRESPIFESIDPSQYTIDYLIPEPKNTERELSPNIICISHFHTHHSPLREIIEFAKIKNITIVCPLLTEDKLTTLKQKIGDYIFNRITFVFITKDTTVDVDGAHIKAMLYKNTMPHIMFFIRVGDKSILHISDATSDFKNTNTLSFSEDWARVYGLRPDYLFVGATGHISKETIHGIRCIREASTLTPPQAAVLTSKIMPKNVGLIGMYNHSVWDDRYEMGMSVGEAEAQFYWCLSYLSPSINVKKLLPGDLFI